MNYTEKVKSELVLIKNLSDSCKVAELSAFIKTAGSIVSSGGNYGFETTSESKDTALHFKNILQDVYGENAKLKTDGANGKKQKTVLTALSEKSVNVLVQTGIIDLSASGIDIKLDLDFNVIEGDDEKASYIRGAFLGCGSATVPKTDGSSSTGYHVEFNFSNYRLATDFCELLSEVYLMPKLVERKGNYVVYIKTVDEIADLLAIMGANKSVLYLEEVVVEKDMNNNFNRKLNCEMGNMSKQMDASAKMLYSIEKIENIVGLETLPPQLRETAIARKENKELSLSALAEKLNVTKSCLSHRLKKITAIADLL